MSNLNHIVIGERIVFTMKTLLFSKHLVEVQNGLAFSHPTKQNPTLVQNGDVIKVFGLEHNALPFCFVVGQENPFIKTTQFNNFQFLEIVDMPKVFVPKMIKTKKVTPKGEASVLGEPYTFNVSTNDGNFCFGLPNNLKNINLQDAKNCVFVDGDVENQDFLVVFHKKTNEFKEFVGSVEFDGNTIKAVNDCHTLAHHGKLQNIEITETGFDVQSEETVYLEQKPSTVPPFLAHIAFFEAVREKDFNLCQSFLCKELAEQLSAQHLQEFFGEFQQIKVIKEDGQSKVALISNQSPTFATARVFCLDFQNGKIADIREES